MDEVVLRPVCDRCMGDGARIPAAVRVVIGVAAVEVAEAAGPLPRPNLMVVDLCASHVAEGTEAGALAAAGRPLSRRMTPPTTTASGARVGRKPGPRGGRSFVTDTCPVCGRDLWGARSMVRHLRAVHQWKTPPVPKRCPDCDYRPARGTDPVKGMNKHRAQAHGWRLIDVMAEVNT